eukprot:6202222-Pleurochrysis_carterae.AAC.2
MKVASGTAADDMRRQPFRRKEMQSSGTGSSSSRYSLRPASAAPPTPASQTRGQADHICSSRAASSPNQSGQDGAQNPNSLQRAPG